MPLLDLTSATGVRYNGQNASAVRLNGTLLWVDQEEPEVPLVERSIFGDTQPAAGYQILTDAGQKYGFLASNYYVPETEPADNDWVIVGIRLWLPAGSSYPLAELSAVGSMATFSTGAISSPRNTPDEIIAGLNQPSNQLTIPSLKAGWNEARYNTPIPYPWHAGVAVGWKIGDGTLYVADSYSHPANAIASRDLDNPFVLSGVDLLSGDQVEKRGEYALMSGEAFWCEWSYQRAHYGSDLIVAKLNS